MGAHQDSGTANMTGPSSGVGSTGLADFAGDLTHDRPTTRTRCRRPILRSSPTGGGPHLMCGISLETGAA